ncbi:hypothetical protein A8C56_05640 [Niabella ginsenosidivorans]|uniref:Uncharacterized protein n=1 Tax=Niabella ginsenosidivorans TaxID=1176587 RepID=A0A1A9I1E1_9BACT|nr:hypothetical protein [Niabella ginsenosidivorans]ANH80540.1 hypothetical protein A8C56_05640 [Niabella ginsenosidivorans]
MQKLFFLLPLFILNVLLFSCGNKNSDFVPKDSIKDYYPLSVGKYITYRVDSTVFVRSGSQVAVHQYQVKHLIESVTTDNQGRQTFVVHRTLRNADGTGNWQDDGLYYITPAENSIEVTEDNIKVIKITNPIYTGASWKGNAYLAADPYADLYDTQAGRDMNTWNFSYYNFGDTTVDNHTYRDVWSVQQNNTVLNIPPTSGTQLGLKEVGFEKYAKGIGMVYRHNDIYDFQGPNEDNPQGTYAGFGISMWMIDHN